MNLDILKTLVILYVEDEQNLQEEVFQNLSPFVEEIITANDGKLGLLEYIKNQKNIDLIISDILMPNMNGIVFIDKVREISTTIPVIYTTAFNDNDYLLKTIQQSISGYILKPIDIEKLLGAIEKASIVIENQRLKKSLIESNERLELRVKEKTQELTDQNELLYYELHTDRLTKLLNRKSLLRDLHKHAKPVLILIDIDSFKKINDIYGEHIGNLVLYEVSVIFKKYSQKIDCTLYKVGSDEFVFLKDYKFSMKECINKLDEIINLVNNKEIYIHDYDLSIRINVTIGVSNQVVNTLETADMALKRAKKERLPYLIYDEKDNIHQEYEDDIKWTKIIENAIENDEIVPFYQPIVAKDGKIIKHEALMRIVTQDEIYTPYFFLSIAKQVKLYSKLEKIMITKVFEKVKKEQLQTTINLSIEDIMNSEFILFIKQQLIDLDIAKFIVFEILENESIDDYDDVVVFIKMAKLLGCSIAIDDFGSGYSNFAHLLKLNPDYIKIDGTLVKNIDKDENAFIIVQTINNFAHNLNIKTIAEFVHSKEVFEVLKEIGIDEYQGYYFSEPKL